MCENPCMNTASKGNCYDLMYVCVFAGPTLPTEYKTVRISLFADKNFTAESVLQMSTTEKR